MDARYSLALLGDFPTAIADEIEAAIQERISVLGLELHKDVTLYRGKPRGFRPKHDRCCAALCARIDAKDEAQIERFIDQRVPLVPVASDQDNFAIEFPGALGALNGVPMTQSPAILAASLLEASSLIPRQRRVFLSYRRKESTEAALQLYTELCALQYDVFLDTHGILPGEHFQEVLWQRLCDCDVLVYLDTPTYFEGRWTDLEFSRASLRKLAMLRVGWPRVEATNIHLISGQVQLQDSDLAANGHIQPDAMTKILESIELFRSKSVAIRYQDLVGKLTASVEAAGGKVLGASSRKGLVVSVKNEEIVVYPELRVPTSESFYEASLEEHSPPVAVIYNEEGIEERTWKAHMKWLGDRLDGHARLVKANTAGHRFQDWY
ncbi:toll/interleukin-1 receptor domain-containing protein [Pseudomonas urmiensis]|uniref:toll/interleukin-1 receptor domain-containing protein n=1 Tax=Pseudomonas urmiensis TaxID=2745493 RepID=UPI003D0E3F98